MKFVSGYFCLWIAHWSYNDRLNIISNLNGIIRVVDFGLWSAFLHCHVGPCAGPGVGWLTDAHGIYAPESTAPEQFPESCFSLQLAQTDARLNERPTYRVGGQFWKRVF